MTQPRSQSAKLEAIRETAQMLGEAAGRTATERFAALSGYLAGFATALEGALARAAAQKAAERLSGPGEGEPIPDAPNGRRGHRGRAGHHGRPTMSEPLRCRIGWWLRRLADRFDHDHAPKAIGWSFTFEEGLGLVWHDNHGRINPKPTGCPVWYLSDADYERAHTEAVSVSTWPMRWIET